MIIAVLSDTHYQTLDEDFCRRIEELAQEVDHFFHCGDMVGREVFDFLNAFPLTAVAGNMDTADLRSSVSVKREVIFEGHRFGLIHGWGSPHGLEDKVLAEFPEADCVCFGHSHRPVNKRVWGKLLFNPGSARDDSRSKSMYGRLLVTPQGIEGQHLDF